MLAFVDPPTLPPSISISSHLHGFAAVGSVVVSLIGFLAAASSTALVEAALSRRKLQRQIASESLRNFQNVSALFGTLDSDFTTRDDNWAHARDAAPKLTSPTSTDLAKKQVRLRLEEIIKERERQESTAKLARITSRTLTAGQYIIGALLTSTLIQSSLSKTWIGVFGLLVILCSVTKQHFHVDENSQVSNERAKKLRALVRWAQDQIAILEVKSTKGEDRSDAFVELLNEMTKSLNQIESVDLSYIPGSSGPKDIEAKPITQ